MRLKLLVIGDYCVGRTWLRQRFVCGKDVQFSNMATVLVDFDQFSRKGRDCNTYNLQMWELSGSDGYYDITGPSFHNASGFLLVFDVTNEKTFDNAIRKWTDYISSLCQNDVPIILVGTKCDLNEERDVSQDRIHTVCDEMNLLYIEVSAKEGINVDFAFKEILEEMICFEKLKSTGYSRV